MKNRAGVLLDRDGTIIVDKNYLSSPSEIELLPGAAEVIRTLNAAGIVVAVITNQSGVARGLFTEVQVNSVHRRLDELLRVHGARIDGYYYCPHHPDGIVERYRCVCDCRKPGSSLLEKAISDYNLDRVRSWMIGDKSSDVEAGLSAGLHTAAVGSISDSPDSFARYKSLVEVLPAILSVSTMH